MHERSWTSVTYQPAENRIGERPADEDRVAGFARDAVDYDPISVSQRSDARSVMVIADLHRRLASNLFRRSIDQGGDQNVVKVDSPGIQ